MNRRGLLASIHCAKRDLGLDDDTYRDVLERVAGARSAKDLTDEQIVRCLEELRRQGAKPQGKVKAAVSGNPHVRHVWALWGSICRLGGAHTPSRAGLRSYIEKRTGVTEPEWLAPQQLNSIIEQLKTWERRLKRKAAK